MRHRINHLSAVLAPTAIVLLLGAASLPSAASDGTDLRSDDSPDSKKEHPEVDESALSERTLALLGDIDSNPAFSERTKEILGEQVRAGFDHFDQAAPDGGDTALSPTDHSGVNEGQFSLESIRLNEPFSGQFLTADCSSTPCAIPELWDIEVDAVYLIWKVISSAALANVEEYINGPGADGRSMKVFLNGVELTQAADVSSFGDFHVYTSANGCGVNNTLPCMVTVIRRDAWYQGPPPWPAWNVVIELWGTDVLAVPIVDVDDYGNPITISSVQVLEGVRTGTVQPRPYLQSFWTDTIGASILSPRCTTCHDMDTTQKIYARHNGTIDGTAVVQEPSILVPGKSVLHCYNCHEVSLPYLGPGSSFPENKWATPTPDLDINWAQIINDHPNTWPSEICGRMLSNLPTAALRQQHFHEDARLFWAVATGDLPVPKLGQSLPTASPHNHTEFLRRFDIWNERGSHCP